MNKTLVITVAGTSTRFRKSLGYDVLKCLYATCSEACILDRLLKSGLQNGFNKIIVVGGYRYSDLKTYLNSYNSRGVELTAIYNEKFDTWGSNYSLYLGLLEAVKEKDVERIVFTEGDLIFDDSSFSRVSSSCYDVITANQNIIVAETSVVFYIDKNKKIKYFYDPEHTYLEIKEPFKSISNSGQVWAFSNVGRINSVIHSQLESDLNGTNLNIVQKYFGEISIQEIEVITFQQWFNCNTVDDYLNAIKLIKL
jgi:choline kinase